MSAQFNKFKKDELIFIIERLYATREYEVERAISELVNIQKNRIISELGEINKKIHDLNGDYIKILRDSNGDIMHISIRKLQKAKEILDEIDSLEKREKELEKRLEL